MNNLKQLFMVGVIALCAAGMTQAVAADGKSNESKGKGGSGQGEGGGSGGSSGSGSNTITFGNSPGMVSGGTMSNTAGTNSGVGSVAQEVTLANPYGK